MPQPDARENLIEHYIKGKTVLDLGAGDIGHRFLHRFVHQTAKHSTALELYPNRATELRKLGYHVVTADAQNFSLGQTFDVIIAGDLIEHLTNLDGFFTSVGHHLQKDGLFIINTPNMYSINLILRGVGSLACECDQRNGLHQDIFNNYIEILDKNLNPCKAGEIGKVYVTNLKNRIMPLIRYDIGDLAMPDKSSSCGCGRGLPKIEKIIGRTVNVFRKRDGTIIDGEYFTHLFYFREGIEKFQVIQKSFDEIHIKVVYSKEGKLPEEEFKKAIFKVMGENCNIKFEYVYNIEPTKSGKFLYTISEIYNE